MKLGSPGWLADLLAETTVLHQRDALRLEPVAAAASSTTGRARTFLKKQLEERGLLYGTQEEGATNPGDEGLGPEARLFRGIVRTLARTALEVASVMGTAEGPRREQLLLLLAVLTGELGTARALDALIRQRKPPSRRQWSTMEAALDRRAQSLAGDPVHGLLLHNGALAVDAQLFGRLSIDYFGRTTLDLRRIARRLEISARHKALLVEVLTALASAERRPHALARKAILRQAENLELPVVQERLLKARVQRAFDGRVDLATLTRGVRGTERGSWLLEQAVLSSLAQGYRSPASRAFLTRLAESLGVAQASLSDVEARVAAFYTAHRGLVDAFTDSEAALPKGTTVSAVQESLAKNFHRLMQEVRETGELSVLLSKVARGHRPTPEEKQRMRAQLIDLAKAVPALALFAAPGGLFLLMALAKVLPFSLLPSAFQDESEGRRKS